ncbi:hypothetical protein ALC56_11842 [Trachymyrmex septentrionalis]|uniref:Uncharacterized protein n=1 Tax=Trachymyrmex septentrionalis TaxID=34720 RepID=A0A151JTK0_9HYME|nr:hypothetical protein ALC56_11842 [Trachymyrmex septentrionalis]
MVDHRANVEDIANVVEHIRNVDPEQFANIRDEMFEEMDVDFEEIMDQDSDEKVLSDDTGYVSDCGVSDLNEHDTDYAENFVPSTEIRALNGHTKHCMIQCYYTMGSALNVCATYMIRLADIDVVGIQVATLVECFAWLQRCDECIERLEEFCRAKRPRIAVGHRQSMVARIARLAGAKTQLERRFVHVGGEYASRDERSLVWREIDAAFESRISTGAVVNVDYIEQRQFLEDAKEIVLERDTVERHGNAKVNTAFNGEFMTNNKHANVTSGGLTRLFSFIEISNSSKN